MIVTAGMTDSAQIRLKRLRFRAWHRGSREADLLFGSFADRQLDRLSLPQLDAFERLLDAEDPDVWDWIVYGHAPPADYESDLIALLRAHRVEPGAA